MVELTRHQNPCNHITFHTEVIPADLILHADENLISQVVINLLKNAVQAIGNQPGGRIAIQAHCNDAEEVLIEIKTMALLSLLKLRNIYSSLSLRPKKEEAESD